MASTDAVSREQELAQERLLLHVALLASGPTSPEEVATAVLDGIREELGDLQAGSVYVLEDHGKTLRHLALFGYPDDVLPSIQELPLSERSNVCRAALLRQVITHESGEEPVESLERRKRMQFDQTRWVAVPIERADELLGVIALFFAGRRPFRQDELRLHRRLATILGTAMQNARLLERERIAREAEAVRATRLDVLHQIARIAVASADLRTVAESVAEELRERLNLTAVLILLADKSQNLLVPFAVAGFPAPEFFSKAPSFPLDSEREVSRVYRTGEPAFVRNSDTDELSAEARASWPVLEKLAGKPIKAAMSVAVVGYRGPVGTMILDWPSPQSFSDEDLAFFSTIAHDVGVGLENARLFEAERDARRRLREKDAAIRRAYVDVIDAVTGGKLLLMTPDELEQALGVPIADERPVMAGGMGGTIEWLEQMLAAEFPGIPNADAFRDACAEALTNTVKHAGGGNCQLYRLEARVQFRVSDCGPGIDFAHLPKATLTPGYSSVGTLGIGFTAMLQEADRVLLATGQDGTTVVLEVPAGGEARR